MEHSPSEADSRSADDELALCVQNSSSVNPVPSQTNPLHIRTYTVPSDPFSTIPETQYNRKSEAKKRIIMRVQLF